MLESFIEQLVRTSVNCGILFRFAFASRAFLLLVTVVWTGDVQAASSGRHNIRAQFDTHRCGSCPPSASSPRVSVAVCDG
jgi:hypothetical protein